MGEDGPQSTHREDRLWISAAWKSERIDAREVKTDLGSFHAQRLVIFFSREPSLHISSARRRPGGVMCRRHRHSRRGVRHTLLTGLGQLDLSYVVMLRRKFRYLESIPEVLVHPSRRRVQLIR